MKVNEPKCAQRILNKSKGAQKSLIIWWWMVVGGGGWSWWWWHNLV